MDWGRLDWGGWGFVVGCVYGRIGAGRRGSSAAWGEDEMGCVAGVSGEKKDVGSGAVEESGDDG